MIGRFCVFGRILPLCPLKHVFYNAALFFGSGVEFETFALLRSSSSLCESDRLNPNPQPRFLSPAPSTEGKLLGAAFPFLSWREMNQR